MRRLGKEGPVETLLIASRRNGLWGIPKGRIEAGEGTSQAAQREAFEEAGVRGSVEKDVFGTFTYDKQGADLYHVSVHVLHTLQLVDPFPERHVRRARWVPVRTAVREVGRAELGELFARLLAEDILNDARPLQGR